MTSSQKKNSPKMTRREFTALAGGVVAAQALALSKIAFGGEGGGEWAMLSLTEAAAKVRSGR